MRTAFSGVDLVVMLAKLDRNASDSDHEYLRSVVRISRQHGTAIDKYAKKTVKVVLLLISDINILRSIFLLILRSISILIY